MKKVDFGKKESDAIIIDSAQTSEILSTTKKFAPIAVIFIVIVVGFIGLSSSYYSVETEENAIVLRFGKYKSLEKPGLHFKMPFGIDKVIKVKTERVFKEEFGFKTLSSSGNRTTYDNRSRLDESLILTGDLSVCEIEWIVQYKVVNPRRFMFEIKDPVSTIRDLSESITRKIIGNENSSDVLTTKRDTLQTIIQSELQKTVNKYDIGVQIDKYLFQNVKPPKAVEDAYNSVNKAKQEKKTMIELAEQEYNNTVPLEKGKANSLIKAAEGEANRRVKVAQGEANRFLSLLDEYKKYPELTRTRLYLETVEKLYPRMKDIIIIDGDCSKSGITPFLPLKDF